MAAVVRDRQGEAAAAAPYRQPWQASRRLYEAAQEVLPGGNTRHTLYFPPFPLYAESAQGAYVTDVDGVRRLDFINNYSALIHGHGHPHIVERACDQISRLMAVAMPTESELQLARRICARVASVERVRFMNSGTEAVMMAIKAARTFTGRSLIAKIEGAYHGSYDYAEVSQASRPDAWGPPEAPCTTAMHPGQPQGVLEEVITLPWSDLEAARRRLEDCGGNLAAVLVDPCPSRLGFAEAPPGYLQMLREITARRGALLIFDEVYCFRLAWGGAQSLFGVTPDLTTFAKLIGGGFPIGAVGGREAVMAVFDPRSAGPLTPHGGTYNGNPVAMAAGCAALDLLDGDAFAHLERLGAQLRDGLRDLAARTAIPLQVQGRGSLAALLVADDPVRDYRGLVQARRHARLQSALHRELLDRRVMATPSGLFMISTAMTPSDIAAALDAARDAIDAVQTAGVGEGV